MVSVNALILAELTDVLTAGIPMPTPEVELESCISLPEDMAIGL